MSRKSRDQRGQFRTMVRYDGRGKIIPGGNILKKGKKPQEGRWEAKEAYECCEPTPTPPTEPTISWIQTQSFPRVIFGDSLQQQGFSTKDSLGNVWTISAIFLENTLTEVTNLSKFNPEGELLFTNSLNVSDGATQTAKQFIGLSILEASDFMYMTSTFFLTIDDSLLPNQFFMSVLKLNSEGVILDEVITSIGAPFANSEFAPRYEFNKSLVGNDDVLYTLFDSLPIRIGQDNLPIIISNDSNLTILAIVRVTSNTTDYSSLYNSGIINNQGYLEFGYAGDWIENEGDSYCADIITLDRNLELIRSFLVDPESVPILGDFDSKAIAQDSKGNYLQLGYDYDLHKYNVNTNEFIWYLEQSSQDMDFENIVLDSNDNIFIISEFDSNDNSNINIIKLNSSGEKLFEYNVELLQVSTNPLSFNIVGNNLIFQTNNKEQLTNYIFSTFRLPLTEPIPGSYTSELGNFDYIISVYDSELTLVQNPGGNFALSDVFVETFMINNLSGYTSSFSPNGILGSDLTKLP